MWLFQFNEHIFQVQWIDYLYSFWRQYDDLFGLLCQCQCHCLSHSLNPRDKASVLRLNDKQCFFYLSPKFFKLKQGKTLFSFVIKIANFTLSVFYTLAYVSDCYAINCWRLYALSHKVFIDAFELYRANFHFYTINLFYEKSPKHEFISSHIVIMYRTQSTAD